MAEVNWNWTSHKFGDAQIPYPSSNGCTGQAAVGFILSKLLPESWGSYLTEAVI